MLGVRSPAGVIKIALKITVLRTNGFDILLEMVLLYTFYQYGGYLLFHYLILAIKAIQRYLRLFHGSYKTLLSYII